MRLQLSTWPEVEIYLQTSQGIIIPIGSTEQHGPTGLIGTDALCAEAIALGVGEKCGALVAPILSVGMALHHLAFPGSLSLRPSTLIQVVTDITVSLARVGFRRFFYLNGHGGNIATLKAAFAETYHTLALMNLDPQGEIRCQVGNWFMARSVYQLARELYGDQEGSHATPSEVALTQFLFPEAIKIAPLSAEVASGHPIYSAEDFRRHYPDGRMGSNPALATPDHGRQFYEAAVAELTESYQNFIA
ncbi:MAG: creatininase family protein [Cyanobacteriota bacterium]|jgi:creatinine amidohydrolase